MSSLAKSPVLLRLPTKKRDNRCFVSGASPSFLHVVGKIPHTMCPVCVCVPPSVKVCYEETENINHKTYQLRGQNVTQERQRSEITPVVVTAGDHGLHTVPRGPY